MQMITDEELQQRADDFVANLPAIQAEIAGRLAEADVSGNPFNSISDARVIGAYGGYAPGLLLGGLEVQILYAYDQVTQEVGIFFYTGGKIGPSLSIPVAGDALAGVFLFEGDLADMAGFSWGIQAASGFAAGLSKTVPDELRLLQLGIEIGVAGEGTAGYTFDVTPSEPVVDWRLTEENLNRLFGSQPDVLQAILAELAIARSLGGGWENDFTEKYGDAIVLNSQECFPAHTPITLADGTAKPIADIRIGDEVLSFRPDGSMVAGTVDKLFRNTTQEFVALSFNDGRDDLVATPGHRFLTETGGFMEIEQMLRLSGGTNVVRLVEKDGSIVTARGEVLVYSEETAHLFEPAQAKATIFDGNLAVKHEAESGWATYNFEVREHHTYIANDIRVHNDSILSFLEEGDTVYALTDDLKDMAVIRDVDGDGADEFVILKGIRNGDDFDTRLDQKFIYTPPAGTDIAAVLGTQVKRTLSCN